jgi:hypothetical protein
MCMRSEELQEVISVKLEYTGTGDSSSNDIERAK